MFPNQKEKSEFFANDALFEFPPSQYELLCEYNQGHVRLRTELGQECLGKVSPQVLNAMVADDNERERTKLLILSMQILPIIVPTSPLLVLLRHDPQAPWALCQTDSAINILTDLRFILNQCMYLYQNNEAMLWYNNQTELLNNTLHETHLSPLYYNVETQDRAQVLTKFCDAMVWATIQEIRLMETFIYGSLFVDSDIPYAAILTPLPLGPLGPHIFQTMSAQDFYVQMQSYFAVQERQRLDQYKVLGWNNEVEQLFTNSAIHNQYHPQDLYHGIFPIILAQEYYNFLNPNE